jgi:hypothetical protein
VDLQKTGKWRIMGWWEGRRDIGAVEGSGKDGSESEAFYSRYQETDGT